MFGYLTAADFMDQKLIVVYLLNLLASQWLSHMKIAQIPPPLQCSLTVKPVYCL